MTGRTTRPPGRSSRGSERRSSRGSGRATTPVGRVSGAGAGVELVSVFCVGRGSTGLGSRPRKTLERRRSSSSSTPGARSAAPVGRSGISICGLRRGGRTNISSPGVLPTNPSRRGSSRFCGEASITLRATRSLSTPRPRPSGSPKSLRGTRVTPRHVLPGSLSRSFRPPPPPPPPRPPPRP